MAARKELLKAQAFVQQRLVSALVDRDPDSPTPPLRRLKLGLFVSILVGALVVAGFGIYGFLKKPGAGLPTEMSILVDSEAGVVFVTTDGKTVYPVTNMASAKLITNGASVRSVKTSALAGTPRGQRYGIVEAPAQLPAPSNMNPFPLRVCSLPDSLESRFTVLDFAAPAVAAHQDSRPTGVVLTDSGNQQYLVINGLAHVVKPEAKGAIETTTVPTPAADALIQSLPLGEPIGKIRVPNQGNPGVDGQRVGDVVQVGNINDRDSMSYWIMLADGWSQISHTDMRATWPDPPVVPASKINDESKSKTQQRSETTGVPLGRVVMTDADTTKVSVCATYDGTKPVPTVEVGTEVDKPSGSPAVAYYDRVTVAPGAGALLRGSNTPPNGQSFLIWEGKKYGIPDAESRAALGYGDQPAIGAVLEPVLRMIPDGLPAGVALDQLHANQPVAAEPSRRGA